MAVTNQYMFDKLLEAVENRELTCFSDSKSKHYLLAIMQEKGLSVERADEIVANFLKQFKSKRTNVHRKRSRFLVKHSACLQGTVHTVHEDTPSNRAGRPHINDFEDASIKTKRRRTADLTSV